MTPEQLRKKALALGAEVEIDGERFNTARQQLKVVPPKPKPAPPAAMPPAPQYLTRQEVQTMLDDLNETWEQRMDILLAAMPKPQPPAARVPHNVAFEYARDGRITGATISPKD